MVVNDGFRVFTCNTVTGKITTDLPVAGQDWGLRLNDAGSLSIDVRPAAEEYAGIDLRGATTPLLQSLGIAYGDTILECGPIWTRDLSDGTLSIEAAGIWSILDKRKLVKGSALPDGANVTGTVVSISGSLGDIAREVVRISIEDNPYGALNIVLPPIEGGSNVRNYQGFDLAWTGDRLRELTEVQNGPDIRFRPRFKADDPSTVEWVMETGTEAQPLLQQTGADWVWDGSVEGSGVVGFSHKQDAIDLAAKAWVPGSGQERSMKLASRTNLTRVLAGYPWTEADSAAKDVEDQAMLQRYADRLAEDSAYPWDTFAVKVRADQEPRLGAYLPGDWAEIIVPDNHPTLDPGPVRVRIMAVDGDESNTVSLTVSPVQDTEPNAPGAGEHTTTSDDTSALYGTWTDLPPGTWADESPDLWNEVL